MYPYKEERIKVEGLLTNGCWIYGTWESMINFQGILQIFRGYRISKFLGISDIMNRSSKDLDF